MVIIERDLTTPQGIQNEMKRLTASIGLPGAHACIVISSCGGDIGISLDANWCNSQYGKDEKIGYAKGETFAEMISDAERIIANWRITRKEGAIRRMALAIIELTDEHAECTRALLRNKGFTDSDMDAYTDAACARASEMCANAPFTVV